MDQDEPEGEVYLTVVDGVLQWVCDHKIGKISRIVETLNMGSKDNAAEPSARLRQLDILQNPGT